MPMTLSPEIEGRMVTAMFGEPGFEMGRVFDPDTGGVFAQMPQERAVEVATFWLAIARESKETVAVERFAEVEGVLAGWLADTANPRSRR